MKSYTGTESGKISILQECLRHKNTIVTPEILGVSLNLPRVCPEDEVIRSLWPYYNVPPEEWPVWAISARQHINTHFLCLLRESLLQKNESAMRKMGLMSFSTPLNLI